jgi:endonuclease YncB( thermonuclease family)
VLTCIDWGSFPPQLFFSFYLQVYPLPIFSAKSSPSSTATPSKSYITTILNASASAASTAQRKAKLTASEPSKPLQLVFGKEVTLQTHGHDKYGRTIADVLLPDGANVNHILVKDGWCWWYRKYAPGDTVLEGLEKEAREGRKGLWADPQPVAPWEWRKRK